MKPTKTHGFIKGFDWGLYPASEIFLIKEINKFLQHNKFAYKLSKRMEKETSTRFFDWIDHMSLPKSTDEKYLRKLGFKLVNIKSPKGTKVYKHIHAIYFPVLINNTNITEIALKPENLNDFTKKIKIKKIIEEKYSPLRKANISHQGNYILTAVERRGTNSFIIEKSNDIKQYKKALQTFSKRQRKFKTDKQGLKSVEKLVDQVLNTLSSSRTADAFFRNERIYWQKRNKAGKIQKERQDKLGLGWGNQDHHTFRSSRQNFTHLIRIFEKMGYLCRERFFAGERAGWGAQILENPQCDIVVFADLDITKKEKDKDFAHKETLNAKHFGTVGLWVALHGESILQSGMHHLEARFNFTQLKKDLPKKGIKLMKAFSNFKFLKQAFTEGEIWKVEKKRLDKLLKNKSINQDRYLEFLKEGALGSHLENLQRRQGYKGFNQHSISAIIKATDPRKEIHHEGA